MDGRLDGKRLHKALGTSDWQKAQQIARDLETRGPQLESEKPREPITVEDGVARYIAHLETRNLRTSTIRKPRLLLEKQLKPFLSAKKVRFLSDIDLDSMDEFRASWKDGALSSSKKLERLRAFFRFAQKRKWIVQNPAADLESPKIASRPTMPFTPEEMSTMIEATDLFSKTAAANGVQNAKRIRALVPVLRYTGMRISDVVGLEAERLNGNRLFLYTQKTGVPVHTILPEFVAVSLERMPRASDKYFFWSGRGLLESAVRSWQTRLRRLFKLAGLTGHAHRFRDTLAVELLMAGVPIERVSILLGHQSVRITEKHYNPWVYARQQQLEADLERAWARDPFVLNQSTATWRLREKIDRVN